MPEYLETQLQIDRLAAILSEIPWPVWEIILKMEPEWQYMEGFLSIYGFGPFAVLMMTTGLNDYQLKGKSETKYWPEIKKSLLKSSVPRSTQSLFHLLVPFYQKERFNTNKVKRLRKFLFSELAQQLWNSSPKEVSTEFINIWHQFAKVMNQKSDKKTIVFTMKCLAISLLMKKCYEFDFCNIGIPVDSRISKLTSKIGFHFYKNTDIQILWSNILSVLRKHESRITMIHLDSLLWQIGVLDEISMKTYFKTLGIPQISIKLAEYISNQNIIKK